MDIYQLTDYLETEQYAEFIECVQNITWHYGAPGGFVTNHPNRQVNAFGNGGPISAAGTPQQGGWPLTHWTAKMSQNNATLTTPTAPIPDEMCAIIPTLRLLFQASYPDAQVTDHTFNIAVCNHYTDPTMTIAEHTDDNPWYPTECGQGPVFASVTLYPEGEPTHDRGYARFQIKPKDKWLDVKLPHASVMIMPSGIRHRVLATRRSDRHLFRPRINITFRSTYPVSTNPLMNAMATANHARYYRLPSKISYPDDISPESLAEITTAYQIFCRNHGCEGPVTQAVSGGRSARSQYRQLVTQQYRKLAKQNDWMPVRMGANMVAELISMVCSTNSSLSGVFSS